MKAQQNLEEFARFTDLLKREAVRSYLEVGAKWGGSLRLVANALPVPSLIVAVDLPWGKGETRGSLERAVADIAALGHRTKLLIGDSTNPKIVAAVRELAPFDAIFIDANHTLPYVTNDWKNYGPMAQIVAFHDISHAHNPKPGRLPIEVPKLWRALKGVYPHEEIKIDPYDNGIGVLWRH